MTQKLKLAIGSDHAGLDIKNAIKEHLANNGYDVTDFGAFDSVSVDYPDFAKKVAVAVTKEGFDRGIVVCGSGVGISIAANKINGIRCALCHNTLAARLSREHNDTNMLAMGSWFTPPPHALEIVEVWLGTEFQGGRHTKRVEKIKELEKESCLKD